MQFKLTEEHEMIRKMVRDFAQNEVAPTAAERDEEERFDREIFDKMAELGLTGIPWPEEYGGIGSDYLARLRFYWGDFISPYFARRMANI